MTAPRPAMTVGAENDQCCFGGQPGTAYAVSPGRTSPCLCPRATGDRGFHRGYWIRERPGATGRHANLDGERPRGRDGVVGQQPCGGTRVPGHRRCCSNGKSAQRGQHESRCAYGRPSTPTIAKDRNESWRGMLAPDCEAACRSQPAPRETLTSTWVRSALSLEDLRSRNLGTRRSVVCGMKRIGWALVLVVGLVACNGGGHHAAKPTPTSAAPTPGTATSTVGVHGSANTSTLSGVIPIGDSTIQARDLQGRMVGTATTNAKGIFSLQLPPGEYDFSVLGSAGGAVGRGPACTTRATVRRMPGGIQVDIRCTSALAVDCRLRSGLRTLGCTSGPLGRVGVIAHL